MAAAAGAGAVVGRLGGDEFAVVVPDADPRAVASSVVDALASSSDGATALPASAGSPALRTTAPTPRRCCAPRTSRCASPNAAASTRSRSTRGTAHRDGPDRRPRRAGAPDRRRGHPDGGPGDRRRRHGPGPRLRGARALPHSRRSTARCTGSRWPTSSACGIELELACLSAALDLLPERRAATRLSVNLSARPCSTRAACRPSRRAPNSRA